MNQDKNTDGYKGNQNAVKSGVYGAIKRISEGKPLIGIAAEEEEAVANELELRGISQIKKTVAIRMQAVVNLTWNTINKTVLEGDLETAERYIKIFSLLSPRALAAWNDVQKDDRERERGGVSAEVVLESLKRERNEKAE